MTTDGEREIASYSRSAYTGMTMVMCEDEARLLAPVVQFRDRLILFGVLTMLLTTLVASIFLCQSSLTEPIRSIQKSISALNLAELHTEDASSYRSSAYELTRLGNAYVEMVDRLQSSLAQTLTAHSREVEARITATASANESHFLYNTITVISIKAEDNGDAEVVRMCEALSGMLRYIVKDGPAFVQMETELSHLNQYL